MLAARPATTVCALCAAELVSGDALCPHHHEASDDTWAAGNRVMCDFVHRGIVRGRLEVAHAQADRQSS